jgi:hypothetical protein
MRAGGGYPAGFEVGDSMAETFDFAAYFDALKNMESAVHRVTRIAYHQMVSHSDFSNRSDYSTYSRVRYFGGQLHYEPITAEEFYAHVDEDGGS